MTISEIIEKYLIDNGYDGLFNQSDDCACSLEDGLFECTGGYDIQDCEPGYKLPGDEEHDFLIGPDKPK